MIVTIYYCKLKKCKNKISILGIILDPLNCKKSYVCLCESRIYINKTQQLPAFRFRFYLKFFEIKETKKIV